jgi:ankyrin repeat protein
VLAKSPLCDSLHPLQRAVDYDQVELFKLLIEQGVDTSAASICKAFGVGGAYCRSIDMLKLLLPYTANTPLKVKCDVSKLAECGDVEGLKFCLQYCPHLWGALKIALDAGHDECVLLMMEHEVCNEVEVSGVICQAIERGQHELLLKLLQQGRLDIEDINMGLGIACAVGNVKISEILLDHGADINTRHRRNCLLDTAASEGHVDIVNLLLARGANVKMQPGDVSGFRDDACSRATAAGHGQVVEVLLKHGMEPWNALRYAAIKSFHADPIIAEMLLQHAVQIDVTKAAVHCATAGSFEMTRYCLERGAGDVAAHFDHCPRNWTSNREDVKLLELMISLGWDVPERKQRLDYSMSGDMCIEAIKLFVEHGANVGSFFRRVVFGDLDPNVLKCLVENGADVTRHSSVGVSNEDVFKLWIELGCDVTRHDFGLLDTAASCKETNVMKLLLAYGGDAHVTACENKAVAAAVRSGSLEMVKILVEHGAGLCSPNKWCYLSEFPDLELGKDWAFLYAVSSGHVDIVAYLLDKHGQDVTVQDNMAVKMAAKRFNLEMVKVLHLHGADLTAIDIRKLEEDKYCPFTLRLFLMKNGVV